MRKISLTPTMDAPVRVLSYGKSGSGKTHWSATWPNVLFLSDASEGGWRTVQTMDPEHFHNRDIPPRIVAIEHPSDLMKSIEQLQKRQSPDGMIDDIGSVETVVIDSLTLHLDAMLLVFQAGTNDTRQVYGKLGQYAQNLVTMLHSLPINVLWLCLEKEPSEDNPSGVPHLAGQSAIKVPARCDYVFYHRAIQSPNQPMTWEIRTKSFQNFVARARGFDRNPLPPTYADFQTECTRVLTRDTPAAPVNGRVIQPPRRIAPPAPRVQR